MAGMKEVVCMVVLCMAVVAPHAEAITCGQVASSVASCIAYLRSGGAVPPNCCGGVRSLNSAARTTLDRQTACNCVKSITKSIPGINYGNAAVLPGKCGVNFPYKISPALDCSKIN